MSTAHGAYPGLFDLHSQLQYIEHGTGPALADHCYWHAALLLPLPLLLLLLLQFSVGTAVTVA
jgi:hypothetical protein